MAGIVKTYFMYFFCTKTTTEKIREYYYKELLKFIENNLVLVKKGNSNPRIKKVSRNKYKINIRKNF